MIIDLQESNPVLASAVYVVEHPNSFNLILVNADSPHNAIEKAMDKLGLVRRPRFAFIKKGNFVNETH